MLLMDQWYLWGGERSLKQGVQNGEGCNYAPLFCVHTPIFDRENPMHAYLDKGPHPQEHMHRIATFINKHKNWNTKQSSLHLVSSDPSFFILSPPTRGKVTQKYIEKIDRKKCSQFF